MVRKSFFQERSLNEINNLSLEVVGSAEGLVDKIEEIDAKSEGLILDFPLVHPAFENEGSPQYVSRKTLRGIKRLGGKRFYPSYIQLKQPRSKESAINLFNKGVLPINIRNMAFFEKMNLVSEADNFNVGYMVWPVSGSSKSPMMIPFWSIAEGCMIDCYNSRECKGEHGSKIERIYGPEVILRVPSRNKKQSKYVIKFSNVPNRELGLIDRAVIGWNTKPAYGRFKEGEFIQDESASPLHKLTNVSHDGCHRIGESFDFTIVYPHCIAAYQELVRGAMKRGDFSPLEMSQFAILSREDASFYNKVRNNLLIVEKNDAGKDVLKKPRIDQKSMLIARRVGNRVKKLNAGEIQETMYWDIERDGRIKDYPFLLGEK